MCTKFYQNRLSFVGDMTKTFGLFFFGSQCICDFICNFDIKRKIVTQFRHRNRSRCRNSVSIYSAGLCHQALILPPPQHTSA